MACLVFLLFPIITGRFGFSAAAPGKEFLISFLENQILSGFDSKPQCVTLTTLLDEDIAVQITSLDPDINFNTSVVINNSLSEYVCLDSSIQLKGTGLSRKVVKVSADNDISVMVHDTEIHSADSYVSIPVEMYGTGHYIVNYINESLLSVTASENNTIVNISFPIGERSSNSYEVNYGGVTLFNPSNLLLTLDEYEVFQLHLTQELTGVYVSSNRPVSVVSGNRKINIYYGGSRDHLAEQMPPVDTWGTDFTSIPSPGKTGIDVYTILASTACTSVRVGEMIYLLEHEGDTIRLDLSSSEPLQILSDKPILVTKFITKTSSFDQCLMVLVPRRQWLNFYGFHFPQMSDVEGYLIIVVEYRFRKLIFLNEEIINIPQWMEVENTNLSVGIVLLPNALYTLYLSETDGYFAAYIQHSVKRFSYCTSIGMNLDRINPAGTRTENANPCTTTQPSITESSTEATTQPVHFTTEPMTEDATTVSIQDETSDYRITETVSSERPDVTCFTPNPELLNLSVTDEVFLDIIEELKQHLKLVPQKTSQAIRKKISVIDYRSSSTTIGMSWLGVVVAGFIVGILGSDLLKIVKDCRYGFRITGR